MAKKGNSDLRMPMTMTAAMRKQMEQLMKDGMTKEQALAMLKRNASKKGKKK